ncbi:MAG: YbhB/YbcL family Raf kinase inhibitor-like protein [Candidatus Acidiferrales bacterium]
MAFEIKSSAFAKGGDIPRKFTCDAQDVSPALNWSEPPKGTLSFALIMDDPDAPVGTWVHWVLYDLPATARSLPEGALKDALAADGAQLGKNSWDRLGYGGPCPPPGPAHRYFFKLYALDGKTNVRPGATKAELEKAMQGHILAQAELMGRYKR